MGRTLSLQAQAAALLAEVRACRDCAGLMPHRPRPVLQFQPSARILIAAQAPGRKVHESGVPFDDASGERLRRWLGLEPDMFYDARRIAIVPMAFCFPGSGRSGDLPPPPGCAARWRAPLLALLPNLALTLVIGRHAQVWHLGGGALTDAVAEWRRDWPHRVVLPHPSPRNNRWLLRNPWFERDLVPAIRTRVASVLGV